MRNAREAASYRPRLKNFPPQEPYHMHVIDYPGGVYGYQPDDSEYAKQPLPNKHFASSPPVNTRFDNQPIQTFQPAPIAPFTPTTTPLPIIVSEPEEIEEYIPPVPTVRAPARRIVS